MKFIDDFIFLGRSDDDEIFRVKVYCLKDIERIRDQALEIVHFCQNYLHAINDPDAGEYCFNQQNNIESAINVLLMYNCIDLNVLIDKEYLSTIENDQEL